jgi:hypothetical protein
MVHPEWRHSNQLYKVTELDVSLNENLANRRILSLENNLAYHV